MQASFVKPNLLIAHINWKNSCNLLLLLLLPLFGICQGIFEYENTTETRWHSPQIPVDVPEQLGPSQYYFGQFFANYWRNTFYLGDPTDFLEFQTAPYQIGQDLKFKITVFQRNSSTANIGIKAYVSYTGVDHTEDGKDPMRSGYQDKMRFSIEPANTSLSVQQFLPGTANKSVSYSIKSGWNASVGFDLSAGVEGTPEGPVVGATGGINGSVGYNYSITSGLNQRDFELIASRQAPQKVSWTANLKNVYSTLDNASSIYLRPDAIVDWNFFTKWLKRPADMAVSTAKFNYFVGYEGSYDQVVNQDLVFNFESEQRTQHSEIFGRDGVPGAYVKGQYYNNPSVFKVTGRLIINIANQTANIIFDGAGPASFQTSEGNALIASSDIATISNSYEYSQLEEKGMTFGPESNVSISGDVTQNRAELTVEAWANNESLENDIQALVSAAGLEFIHFQMSDLDNVQNTVYLNDGRTLELPIIPALSPGWHHVALSVKSGDSKVFVDGQQLGETNTTLFSSIKPASTFTIGKGFAGERNFSGKIANVRIWDYAKSREELSAFSLAFSMNHDPHLLYFSPTSNSISIHDSSQSLDVPASATIEMERVTVEAWINNASSLNGIHAIVSSTGPDFVHLQASNHANVNNVVYLSDGRVIYLPVIPPLSPGWHHVALVAESGNSRIYVDGQQLGAADSTVFTSIKGSDSVFIGKGWDNGRVLNGAIADVRIWQNHALTPEEINQLRHVPPTGDVPGLSFHYK